MFSIFFLITIGFNYFFFKFFSNIGCGGILTTKIGSIMSPEFSKSNTNILNCSWIISAPEGNIIQVTFVRFHLGSSHECSNDYLMVMDNNTVFGMGGVIGKYCGTQLPPTILSTANLLTIKFLSHMSLSQEGFLATYMFVPETSCKFFF